MNDLFDLVGKLKFILDSIIPILIGLAVLLFIYGLLRYIISSNEQVRRDAINTIVYGIVALFIMVSIWSIVSIIGYTLGIDTGSSSWLGTKGISIENLIR